MTDVYVLSFPNHPGAYKGVSFVCLNIKDVLTVIENDIESAKEVSADKVEFKVDFVSMKESELEELQLTMF